MQFKLEDEQIWWSDGYVIIRLQVTMGERVYELETFHGRPEYASEALTFHYLEATLVMAVPFVDPTWYHNILDDAPMRASHIRTEHQTLRYFPPPTHSTVRN